MPSVASVLTDRTPLDRRLTTWRSQDSSTAPVVGLMTTVPECAEPLTEVKSPATRSSPLGRASRSWTWLLKSKESALFHSPVLASKAASAFEGCTWPDEPCWTPVKLPPTNMVPPTWAKACTWMLPSATEPVRLPLTPQLVRWAYSDAALSVREGIALVPVSGIEAKPGSSEPICGRTYTSENGKRFPPLFSWRTKAPSPVLAPLE